MLEMLNMSPLTEQDWKIKCQRDGNLHLYVTSHSIAYPSIDMCFFCTHSKLQCNKCTFPGYLLFSFFEKPPTAADYVVQ